MKESGPWRALWRFAIPILLAIAAYLNTLEFEFVWDDIYLILQDHTIKSPRYLGIIFQSDFFGHQEDDLVYGYFRPLVSLSYMLDYAIWSKNPFGFHLTNIILHAVATFLFSLSLTQLTQKRWVVSGASMLFAVHPIHVESVAWISGRTDILAFVFAMTALIAEVQACNRQRFHVFLHIAAPILFAMALLSKEMAVVMIPAIGIVRLHFLRHHIKRIAVGLIPYVVILGLYLVWRFAVVRVDIPAQSAEISLTDKALMMPWTVLRYLSWLLVPIRQSAYVKNPYISGPTDPRLYLGILGVGAILYLVWRFRDKRPMVGAALLLGVTFLPILNLVAISAPLDMGFTMAERFLYFSSAPFSALAAAAIERLSIRRAALSGFLVAGGAVIVFLASAATINRNRVWKDNEVFYTKTFERVPSALMMANLANHYIAIGKWNKAQQTLKKAKKYFYNNYHYMAVQASFYVAKRQYRDAVVLQQKIAKSVKRGRAVAYNNLAFLYRMLGDSDRAEALLSEVVYNKRGYGDVFYNLAEVYRAQKRFSDARRYYEKALMRRPDNLQYAGGLGNLLIEHNRLEEASTVYERQLEMHPDDPGVLNNLGVIYEKMKQNSVAIERFAEAIRRHPGYTKARLNLAGALLTAGRTKEADRHLRILSTHAKDTPEGQRAAAMLEHPRRAPPLH